MLASNQNRVRNMDRPLTEGSEEDGVVWMERNGIPILFIDLKGHRSMESARGCLLKAMGMGQSFYEKNHTKHSLVADLYGVEIDEEFMEFTKTLGRISSHRLDRVAVVGITNIQRILLTSYNLFTWQSVHPFDSVESAVQWVSEK